MQQSTYSILLYSVLSLFVFFICPKKIRKYILLFSSCVFYALCDIKFLGLIIIETFVTWIIGNKIISSDKEGVRFKSKKFLIIGILFTLLILFIFKYFNFFIDCFNIRFAHIVLPLGISYFSFKIISYLVDVFTEKNEKETSLINYAIYIMFFPHLICGPIVRASSILNKLKEELVFNISLFCNGLMKVVLGLFMKVVIAERCGEYVDLIFNNPSDYPSLALILALCLYTIQLYCDFAGYSEIAVGLTKMFGFDCIDNFKRPYLSVDIRDFWRRWHISLSTWLRDYIYIPLGGNRCSKLRKWFNVFSVFIACGIWHGSSLHFVIWGAYHGLLNNLTPKKRNVFNSNFVNSLFTVFRWFITMLLVMFGWLLFRADSLSFVALYIYQIFTKFSLSYQSISSSILPFTGDNSAPAYCLILFFMIVILFVKEFWDERKEKDISNNNISIENYSLIWTGILVVMIVLFGITGTGNFLYANF